MRAPLIVVSGTGTGVGKTYVSVALVRAWSARGAAVAALKPIESGVCGAEGNDGRALREAATFHVKPPRPLPYLFPDPVSPHLAARHAGITIDPALIVSHIDTLRRAAGALILELAGGLFSPLAPDVSNATLARALEPTALLLVAPDRLGVLHDVLATTVAASSIGVSVTGIALSAPPSPDASTGHNAAELHVLGAPPVMATFARTLDTEDSASRALMRLLASHPQHAPPTPRN